MASYKPITLDTNGTDDQGMLVLCEGRLTAILSHLSAIHDEMAGLWYLEMMFGKSPAKPRYTFANPEEFVDWLDEAGLN